MSISFITRFFHLLRPPTRIKRFELLLPLKYNDGREIESEKLDQATMELTERFEGVTQDLIKAVGIWKYGSLHFRDELVRFRIDTADHQAIPFFRAQKEVWKTRLEQIDIWITAHEIEVI